MIHRRIAKPAENFRIIFYRCDKFLVIHQIWQSLVSVITTNCRNDCSNSLIYESLLKITRPQLRDFLKAIREYTSGKYFNLPNDKLVRINRDGFSI